MRRLDTGVASPNDDDVMTRRHVRDSIAGPPRR